MMTIEESRKRTYKTRLLLIAFFCVMIIGLSGAIYYYLKLRKASTQLANSEKILQVKNDSLRKVTNDLHQANQYLESSRQVLANQKSIIDSLITRSVKDKNPSLLINLADSINTGRSTAAAYENLGYMKLKEKDLVAAKDAFNKSEKSYNGYHQVYEIWFLLYKNKDKLNDPEVKQQLLKQILTNYNRLGFLKPADIQ
jgi:hypothetical protein